MPGGGLGGDGGGGKEKFEESELCLVLFLTPSISFESFSLSLECVDSFSLSCVFLLFGSMTLVPLCLAERRLPSVHCVLLGVLLGHLSLPQLVNLQMTW